MAQHSSPKCSHARVTGVTALTFAARPASCISRAALPTSATTAWSSSMPWPTIRRLPAYELVRVDRRGGVCRQLRARQRSAALPCGLSTSGCKTARAWLHAGRARHDGISEDGRRLELPVAALLSLRAAPTMSLVTPDMLAAPSNSLPRSTTFHVLLVAWMHGTEVQSLTRRHGCRGCAACMLMPCSPLPR